MKIFADTANLREIEEALKRGFIRGVTTNPSLLSQEPKDNYLVHIARIVELLNRYQGSYGEGIRLHLSVEVFSRDTAEIIRQAQEFSEKLNYRHLSVKVQIGWDELEAIARLSKSGFSVNCTCCMSVNQAVMAAAAGARYVSLFWGRIRDGGADPFLVVSDAKELLQKDYPNVEIIVGSIRQITDITDAGLAGADIVTVPPKFYPQMIGHFKTDEVVNQFLTDFKNWLS